MPGEQVRNSFKLVILGDTAVGKSCLVTQFVRGEYSEFQEPTIGAAFLTSTVVLENRKVNFEIWDTAGQERYRALAPMYYRAAEAAVIVYDITSLDSFAGAKNWAEELKRRITCGCVIALVGNKCDLETKRKVDRAVASEYASNNGYMHMDVSAKTALRVNELFHAIAEEMQTGHTRRDAEPATTVTHKERNYYSRCC